MNIVLGMGNGGHGDDGAGVAFARVFRLPGWQAVPVGTVPENAGGLVRRAGPGAHVVVVDAAELGLPPGAIRRLRPADLESAGFGTHAPDPAMLDTYLRLSGAADVIWIGIQPQALGAIPGLTPPVKAALRALLAAFRQSPPLATLPWWRPGQRGAE